MSEIDNEWVREQLTLARAQVRSGNTVLKLLEFWETLEAMEPDEASKTLEMFSSLAQGHPIVEPESDGIWVPAMRGQFSVGDRVRVKRDGFAAEEGRRLNGRVGRIVAVRSGRVVFRSDDAIDPLIDGEVFFPEVLEKRIR